MKRLRLATEEEVNRVRQTADLDTGCIVIALDTAQGTGLAVLRTAVEVDPVYFAPEWNTKLRSFFIRDIETYLSAKDVKSYYFNVAADAEEWIEHVKHWGSEQVSKGPELRFKQTL